MNQEDILKLEQRRYEALVEADSTALDALIADDVCYIHTNGIVDSKASLIDSLSSGARKYLGMKSLNSSVRTFAGCHIITGELQVSYIARGEAHETTIAHTSVWLTDETGRTQLVSWHSSPSTFGKK